MARGHIPQAMEESPLLENMVTPISFGSGNASQPKAPVAGQEKENQGIQFPAPAWTSALKREERSSKRKIFPQTISHRGYNAKYPENSMISFEGAVNAGTHALETDIHLSKDGVVVLSHDPTLKRCFGEKTRIIDCDWEYLRTLRTTKAPHVPMPRLIDLLKYLNKPELKDIWVLLDIKLDNNANDVMRLIAEAISSVPPSKRRWENRIVLGCWAATHLPLCDKYLPSFPVTLITVPTSYARHFLKVPNIGFNMHQKILMGPLGGDFLQRAKEAQRPFFVWTVNDTNLMKWSVRHGVDGVVTDDPAKFTQLCDDWDDNDERGVGESLTLSQRLQIYSLIILVFVLGPVFRWRFPVKVDEFVSSHRKGGT